MTTIFYFSGSGNSLAIARDLAAELDGDSLVASPLEIGLLATPMEFIS